MDDAERISKVLATLHTAYITDRDAVRKLFAVKIPCSDALAAHPSVVVGGDTGQHTLSILGLLNGLLSPIMGVRIAAIVDEKTNELRGFMKYMGPVNTPPIVDSNPPLASLKFEPEGVKFRDNANGGRELLLVAGGEWDGWLCYRHADGHWVSLRKATKDDLDRIGGAVKEPLLDPTNSPHGAISGPQFGR